MIYLLDGHNIMFRLPTLENLLKKNSAEARDLLINMVITSEAYKRGNEILIYFDNKTFPTGSEKKYNGIKIIYSAQGKKADDFIAKKALSLRNSGKDFCLVTGDIQLKNRISGKHMKWLSVENFFKEKKSSIDEYNEKPQIDENESLDYWLEMFGEKGKDE